MRAVAAFAFAGLRLGDCERADVERRAAKSGRASPVRNAPRATPPPAPLAGPAADDVRACVRVRRVRCLYFISEYRGRNSMRIAFLPIA